MPGDGGDDPGGAEGREDAQNAGTDGHRRKDAQDERAALASLVTAVRRQSGLGLGRVDRWLGTLDDAHSCIVRTVAVVDVR